MSRQALDASTEPATQPLEAGSPQPKRTSRTRWLGRLRFALAALTVPAIIAGLVALSVNGYASNRVPALIVNEDEMVQQTAADGTQQPVVAGRLVVSALVKPGSSTGFDWQLASADEAREKLERGEAQVVVTIPRDFSASVISAATSEPRRAQIDIRTDQQHSYLAGAVSGLVGDTIAGTIGRDLSKTMVKSVLDGLAQSVDGLKQSADGASKVADGIDQYTAGVTQVSSGAKQYTDGVMGFADGASSYVDGVHTYAAGARSYVDGVQRFAGGIVELAPGIDQYTQGVGRFADGASQYVDGVNAYIDGVQRYAAGGVAAAGGAAQLAGALPGIARGLDGFASELDAITSDLEPLPGILDEVPAGVSPRLDAYRERVSVAARTAELRQLTTQVQGAAAGARQAAAGAQQLAGGLQQLGDASQRIIDGGEQLRGGGAAVQQGAAGVSQGGARLASGASALAGAAPALISGGDELASGGATLASGGDELAAGGAQLSDAGAQLTNGLAELAGSGQALADGSRQLADGLQSGYAQASSRSLDADRASDVMSTPVVSSVDTAHPLTLTAAVGVLAIALALWSAGFVATVLRRSFRVSEVTGTSTTGRLLARETGVHALVGAVAGIVLTLLMHALFGIDWSLAWVTVPIGVLAGAVMAVVHVMLGAFGRRTLVIASVVLAALQLTIVGGLLPSGPWLSPIAGLAPITPIGAATSALQTVVARGDAGGVIAPIVVLLLIAAASYGVALLALRSRRRRLARAALAL